MGEGASILILESLEHAIAKVKILCEHWLWYVWCISL